MRQHISTQLFQNPRLGCGFESGPINSNQCGLFSLWHRNCFVINDITDGDD